MKYVVNSEISEILDDDYTLILLHNQGDYFRIKTNIWNNIKYYVKKDIEVEACLNTIFSELKDAGAILERETIQTQYDNVLLQLTSKCNLHCKHCIASDFECKGELDIKLVDSILKLNPKTISMTGGEPMLCGSFEKIVTYIKESGFDGRLILLSNGTLVNDDNIDFLCENFDAFELSLDGYDEETVSKIRGEGVFDKICQVCANLRRNGKMVSLSTVLYGDNIDKKRFFELTRMLDVKPIIRRLFISDMLNANINNIFEGGFQEYLKSMKNFLKNAYEEDVYLRKCSICNNNIFIDVNGNIYPCGNLVENKCIIGKITENGVDINTTFRKELIERLSSCRGCRYIDGCWECIAEVLNYSKNKDVFKHFCDCSMKKWQNIVEGVY